MTVYDCLQSERCFPRLWFLSSEQRVVLPFPGVVAHPQPQAPSQALDRLLALAEPPESLSRRKWFAPMAPSGVSPPTPGRARPPPAKEAEKPPWPQRCRRWLTECGISCACSTFPGETEAGLPEQRQWWKLHEPTRPRAAIKVEKHRYYLGLFNFSLI